MPFFLFRQQQIYAKKSNNQNVAKLICIMPATANGGDAQKTGGAHALRLRTPCMKSGGFMLTHPAHQAAAAAYTQW